MEDIKNTKDYEKIEIEETINIFNSNIKTGLNKEQVNENRDKFGLNELTEKKQNNTLRFLKRLWGPIPWMIEIAAILSAVVHKWEDFIIILILLFTNVIIDFWQESKALSALKILKQKLALTVIVLREGKFIEIENKFLVPGDIIKIKIGSVLPADIKILETDFIQLDQSSLTGESLPVSKIEGEVGFANSIVKKGECLGLVVNTGFNTYFGKTAALVARAENEKVSHFQKAVIHIGNYLIIISVILALLIVITALFRGEDMINILRFVLVLTVAAIPVALPAVLSVTLVVGAMNLAKKKAIVSHLVAIEELAGVDILCADKTGTLTKNQMSVGESIAFNNYSVDDLLFNASLASRREDKDPLEKAIFDIFDKKNPNDELKKYVLEKYIPFDPINKKTEGIYNYNNSKTYVTKGAVQVILDISYLTKEKICEINLKVEEFAKKGFRTLAVARKNGNEQKYTFLGIIPLFDPPRDDSAEVISNARDLGVGVKMITGDNLAIAKQISKVLNIGEKIFPIEELKKTDTHQEYLTLAKVISKALYLKLSNVDVSDAEKFSKDISLEVKKELENKNISKGHVKKHESEIIAIIERSDGFAQVFPEDKFFIVDSLQKGKHMIAMTGDGVNDSPALKKADCGIAVSGATDAARAAADIILTLPGLSVIVDAIKQARFTFERMKSYTLYRITETIRVILFMTLAIVIFNFYPVTAIMIIMLALLNDIPILTIAYDRTIANSKPVKWDMNEILTISTILGVTGVISTFFFFFIVMKFMNLPVGQIQSLIFLKLLIAGHLTIFATRLRNHFWTKPYPAPSLLWSTILTKIIGILMAAFGILIPRISWGLIGFAFGYAILEFLLLDTVKTMVYKKHLSQQIKTSKNKEKDIEVMSLA